MTHYRGRKPLPPWRLSSRAQRSVAAFLTRWAKGNFFFSPEFIESLSIILSTPCRFYKRKSNFLGHTDSWWNRFGFLLVDYRAIRPSCRAQAVAAFFPEFSPCPTRKPKLDVCTEVITERSLLVFMVTSIREKNKERVLLDQKVVRLSVPKDKCKKALWNIFFFFKYVWLESRLFLSHGSWKNQPAFLSFRQSALSFHILQFSCCLDVCWFESRLFALSPRKGSFFFAYSYMIMNKSIIHYI